MLRRTRAPADPRDRSSRDHRRGARHPVVDDPAALLGRRRPCAARGRRPAPARRSSCAARERPRSGRSSCTTRRPCRERPRASRSDTGTTGFSPVTHSARREAAAQVRADERPRLLEVLARDRRLDEAHRDPACRRRERCLDERLGTSAGAVAQVDGRGVRVGGERENETEPRPSASARERGPGEALAAARAPEHGCGAGTMPLRAGSSAMLVGVGVGSVHVTRTWSAGVIDAASGVGATSRVYTRATRNTQGNVEKFDVCADGNGAAPARHCGVRLRLRLRVRWARRWSEPRELPRRAAAPFGAAQRRPSWASAFASSRSTARPWLTTMRPAGVTRIDREPLPRTMSEAPTAASSCAIWWLIVERE